MAQARIWFHANIIAGNRNIRIGSESNPVEITLDGDGKVHDLRWDDVDTSSAAVVLYDSTASSIPSGAKLFFVRASVSGQLGIDDGTSNGVTSAVPIYANVWQVIGGRDFAIEDSALTAAARALKTPTQIDRIVYQADTGTSADVELIGVS